MILVIDDDKIIRSSLSFLLKRAGYETLTASNPNEALEIVRTQIPELMLMDMNYSMNTSGDEGLELIQKVKIFCPETPVILMTAWGSISLAVEGMRLGAFDFITKPWDNLNLLKTIKTALDLKEESNTKNDISKASPIRDKAFSKIIGKSASIKSTLELVSRVAKTNASILITGESGTGKELIAEAIHALSPRSTAPFIKVNLGGINQQLFESELFGHKKGSFTDAYTDRDGRFTLADKGTIFLDEIGDLELSSQVKLLRVLQEQTFEVLGDSRPKKVDVRVVSATNKDLPELIAEGSFREDLYYRINLIPIHLAPLRERREDIPLLVNYFIHESAKKHSLSIPEICPRAISYLVTLPFYGNIRELKNLIERAVLVNDGSMLTKDDFEVLYGSGTAGHGGIAPAHNSIKASGDKLDDVEMLHIKEVLEKTEHNISKAARELGLSHAALYRRMEKYKL